MTPEEDKQRVYDNRLDLAEMLDRWHHKGVPFLGWACDWYDRLLQQGIDDTLEQMGYLAEYALRCPKCEGYDFPGVSHNTDSPECSEYSHGTE